MKLAELKLFPFRIRLFFRLNVFCYKILNHQILPIFFDKLEFIPQSLTRFKKANELVKVPFEGTKHGLARLSIFLPNFVNKVMLSSYNHNFNDFKNSLLANIFLLYEKFFFLIFILINSLFLNFYFLTLFYFVLLNKYGKYSCLLYYTYRQLKK